MRWSSSSINIIKIQSKMKISSLSQKNPSDLIKFINSNFDKLSSEDIEVYFHELIRSIKPKFSEIIKHYKENKNFFFRGMKKTDPILLYVPRKDRKPLNTDIETHNFFNVVFNKITKNEINRTNSVFVTSDFYEARNYGNVYVVFPMNGFKYIFSDKIKDLYLYSNKFLDMFFSKKKFQNLFLFSFFIRDDTKIFLIKNNSLIDDFYEEMGSYIEQKTRKKIKRNRSATTPIQKAEDLNSIIKDYVIMKNNMIKKDEKFHEILKKYTDNIINNKKFQEIYIKNISEKYHFNKNLKIAFKNKNEVMIKTDLVLCFNWNVFGDLLEDLINT